MARRRGFENVRDMVLSLGLVLGVVAVVFLITLRQTPEAVKVVDAKPVLESAAVNAPYAPVALAPIDGWRITSARVSEPCEEPFRWHVGYYTSTGTYAAVGQSNGSTKAYLKDERATGTEGDPVTINGITWTRLERADGQRQSLVTTRNGVTTLVTTSGGVDELTTLAKALGSFSVASGRAAPTCITNEPTTSG